jgi:hypothetical protein
MKALLACGAATIASNRVEGTSVGLYAQERAQRSSVCVEAIWMAPERDEHLLGHIFRHGGVTGNASGQSEYEASVTLEDLGKCFFVSRRQPRGQQSALRVHATKIIAGHFVVSAVEALSICVNDRATGKYRGHGREVLGKG